MAAIWEIRIFAGCFCSGILIGIIYDILSMLRYPFHSVVADGFFDFIFYIFVLVIAAAALFLLNDGIIRFYSLCGILSGCAAYMRFPSRLFRRLARKTLKIIHK